MNLPPPGGTVFGGSRRAVVAWMVYDFADAAFVAVIPATVYSKFYALEVVGNEHGQGDAWWSFSVTLSMLVVALASPPMGAIADHAGVRKRFLTLLTALSVGAMALMSTVGKGDVLWGFTLAVAGTVGFEGALVYYNAYLPDLATPARRGRLSAYGFAAHYGGAALALTVALPFAAHDRYGAAFLAAALLFGVFAVPAMLFLPADRPGRLTPAEAVRLGFGQTVATLKRIARQPALRGFLLAFLFYYDGVNTVVFFAAIFAGHTLGFTTVEVIELFFVVQFSALAGAFVWGRPTDARGPRFVIMCTLLQWCLVVTAAYFVTTKAQFYVVAVLAGSGLGAIQSASRTFMANLIPPGQEAELFAFYALVGKTSAILGPIIFGGVSRASGGNQRLAILAVGAMFVMGLGLLARVPGGGPVAGPTAGRSGEGTSPRNG